MKNNNIYFGFIASLLMLAFSSVSCHKDSNDPVTPSTKMEDMKISPDFKFSTSQEVGVKILTLDNANAPIPNIKVEVYTDFPESGGGLILSGASDNNGVFASDYKIPAGVDSLVVGTSAIGFCNMQKVKISGGSLNLTLGGKKEPLKFKSGGEAIFKSTNSVFKPLGTYNSSGVPNYLVTPNDVIDAVMISDINATLPERIAAPTGHPQYV
jgi:hypothetical protein